MTIKKIQPSIMKQLEEALEERQTDRRKQKAPIPSELSRDRRQGDRRSKRMH